MKIDPKSTLFFLAILSFLLLGICIGKYHNLSINTDLPSWDSLFNFIAIISALAAIWYQVSTSKQTEIEASINALFLDIDSVKFKASMII